MVRRGQNGIMVFTPRWVKRYWVVCALKRHPMLARMTTDLDGVDNPTSYALECPCGRKSEPAVP